MTARWTERNPRWTWLAAGAILLLLDQSTKSYFSTILELGEAVQVTDWLNFVHVLNTGAAFSLLADASGLTAHRITPARGSTRSTRLKSQRAYCRWTSWRWR